jgi:hypothetical protein
MPQPDGTLTFTRGHQHDTIEVDEDGHLRGRMKLRAIVYLLAEMDPEMSINGDVCAGLSWIIEECVDQMSIGLKDPDGGAR